MGNMGDSPLRAIEKRSESEDKRMRLPLRVKKAGKNVVPTLTMKKSWISYRIITFMEPMGSLTSQGHQVNQIPQRDRRQNGTHSVSPLAECGRQMWLPNK